MASASTLAPPPYDSDIIDPAGVKIGLDGIAPGSMRMSPAFAIWLQQLFTTGQNSESIIVNNVFDTVSPVTPSSVQDLTRAAAFSPASAPGNRALQKLSDLEKRLAFRPTPSSSGTTAILIDTYANWTTSKYNPTAYPVGTVFVIEDHNGVSYIVESVSGTNEWIYYSGIYSVPQSGISGIKGFNGAALATPDSGLLIYVVDYNHVLQWYSLAIFGGAWAAGSATMVMTGAANPFAIGDLVTVAGVTPSGYNSASVTITSVTTISVSYAVVSNPGAYVSGGTVSGWSWGPGENGSGYFQDFAVAPAGAGWQACDGSSGVSYLKASGTTGTINLPACTVDPAFAKAGSVYGSIIHTAVAPTIGGFTETATIGFVPATAASAAAAGGSSVASGTGALVSVLVPPFSGGGGGGGGSLINDPHYHNLTSGDAPISLPADPVQWFAVMKYFRQ